MTTVNTAKVEGNFNDMWEARYEEVKNFVASKRRLPSNEVEGEKELWAWLNKQHTAILFDSLTKYQFELLELLPGFKTLFGKSK